MAGSVILQAAALRCPLGIPRAMWIVAAAAIGQANPAHAQDGILWQAAGLREEGIVLRGEQMPALVGQPVANLEVLTCTQDGKTAPVPFQVDPVDEDGRYVLPEGPDGVSLSRTLGARDELVFMARTVGGVGGCTGALRKGTGYRVGIALGKTGFQEAIVRLSASPIRSSEDFVSWSPSEKRITGRTYRYGIDRQRGFFIDEVSTGSHGNWNDLVDRLKIRLHIELLQLVDFDRTEADFDQQIVAWRDGPVRVIRRNAVSLRLLFGLLSPRTDETIVHWPNRVESPSRLEIPFDMAAVTKRATLTAGLDLGKGADGMKVLVEGESVVATAGDGQVDVRRPARLGEWIALYGDKGAMIYTFDAPDFRSKEMHLVYQQNPVPDEPEAEPGQRLLGYVVDLPKLKKGVYDYRGIVHIPYGTGKTEMAAAMDAVRRTPRIQLVELDR